MGFVSKRTNPFSTFTKKRTEKGRRAMKKIKVLFFIYQMGAGGAARTLLNILNNLDRDKYEPTLITLDYMGSYESEVKEDIAFQKLPTQRLSRSVFKLAKIIRNKEIDLVFSTIPRVNTISILATKLSFTKAKCIVREASNLDGNWIDRLKLRGFGLIYKFADQVISLSEGVKENLVKRYKLKPEEIKVIYNPVDLNAIAKKIATDELSEEHKELFTKDKKNIVTAGRLVDQKDQKTMIRAFAKVKETIAARLIILGEGPLEESLRQTARQLGVEADVHFIGFQNNPYLYFEAADLFVLTSRFEGFAHVLAEALATGTPIVSTNCKSGPSEVLDNGKYGRLVPVGDTEALVEEMVTLLSLAEEPLHDIINKGYERAKFFNAPDIIKQYESVFEDVIQ